MGLTVKYKLKKTWSFKITPYLYTRKWYQGNRPPVDRNKFCLRLLLLLPSCLGFPFPSIPPLIQLRLSLLLLGLDVDPAGHASGMHSPASAGAPHQTQDPLPSSASAGLPLPSGMAGANGLHHSSRDELLRGKPRIYLPVSGCAGASGGT